MGRTTRLFLVEDEDGLRRLVAQFLRLEGFHVVEAGDGLEAVQNIDDGSAGPLDLAILDLNLPGLHGVEVARHLRRALPSLPLVVCSAAIVTAHEQELLALGVRHFLTKPYHPGRLLEVVRGELACPLPQAPSFADLVRLGPIALR